MKSESSVYNAFNTIHVKVSTVCLQEYVLPSTLGIYDIFLGFFKTVMHNVESIPE